MAGREVVVAYGDGYVSLTLGAGHEKVELRMSLDEARKMRSLTEWLDTLEEKKKCTSSPGARPVEERSVCT